MRTRAHVFIAGGGFIGKALGSWLVEQGADVCCGTLGPGFSVPWVRPIQLLDEPDVARALRAHGPGFVFQLAGAVGEKDPGALEKAHIETTRTLLRCVKEACPQARVVVLGSAAEYGTRALGCGPIPEDFVANPVTAYGRSKLRQSELAETLGRELGIDVVRVRLFNTLGAGQSRQLVAGALVERLRETLAQGVRRWEVADFESERDFLDVRDVVRLLWLVASRLPRAGTVTPVQIASGVGTSIRTLAERLLAVADAEDRVDPTWAPRGAAPTTSVGAPSTLRGLLDGETSRRVSIDEALRGMWSFPG